MHGMSRVRSDIKKDIDTQFKIVFDLATSPVDWAQAASRSQEAAVKAFLKNENFLTPPPPGGNETTDARSRVFRHICIEKVRDT
jgi:hypothetical protein